MSYYMILVLDPDFSAEEIRNAKRAKKTNHTKSFASGTENEVAATRSGMERRRGRGRGQQQPWRCFEPLKCTEGIKTQILYKPPPQQKKHKY
jgi:hypothetical protein